jgi:glyoxylase-like metal-dependent hydrolase (beta-lactamase superfamily II)
MNLHVIETGMFKLDGGAMFGVVPKSIWQKTNPADENNLCTWSMRCLLIEEGDRLILIDTGIGEKLNEKMLGHLHLHGNANLTTSLHDKGFSPDDITDVFLTHLHFDHCGGAINMQGQLAFKNATYWSNEAHWNWATKPNDREKASFLTENILPIAESGQLKMIPDVDGYALTDEIKIQFVSGHTESMMLPHINYKGQTIVYMADLLPSIGHLPIPYVMAYDTRPLISMEEKKSFLLEAEQNQHILFFEHDPVVECCTVELTEKGIRANKTFRLEDL